MDKSVFEAVSGNVTAIIRVQGDVYALRMVDGRAVVRLLRAAC
ncbi:hypothetical protein [Stenotrophomonas humi]|nr:hypothetical protein [Stenotrophomonas humi]